MTNDAALMHSALGLAQRALGTTSPNPSVGCIITDSAGRIVGRGMTQAGGRPHAEVTALAQAGHAARGGTAYVTLEPCAHTGMTGPCAQALVSAGVARVVSALEDPDPRVQGRGHSMLRQAGIEVLVGVLAAQARAQNEGFISRITRGRPMVTVKVATSLDGKIALSNGLSQWITGPQARRAGHHLRATHDMILTGIGTVLADDPQLSCRLDGMDQRSPLRCVLDMWGGLPVAAQLLSAPPGGRVLVYTSVEGAARLKGHAGVETTCVEADAHGRADLSAVLADLGARGITRLLVEAGPGLTTGFVRSGHVDRLVWFRSAQMLGGDAAGVVGPLDLTSLDSGRRFMRVAVSQLGFDLMETYAPSA